MQKLQLEKDLNKNQKTDLNTYSISFVSYNEFKRILDTNINKYDKLTLLSEMCRLNTLSSVKKAGSGHLGTSLSSMDIFVWLYFSELNTARLGAKHPDRDIFFSSKGHDCPGQYAVLAACGILPSVKLFMLRKLGGLDGHPDVKIPGIEAHSGSLGMGISKGKGMALAKKLNGAGGRVIVLTGDGELQEGQIWESLQTTAHQKITNIIVIVDHNKIQTDKLVKDIIDLGDLEKKFVSFGWHVSKCNGHNFAALEDAFAKLNKITNKPKILMADTIKGKGVSFMEGPQALKDGNGLYRWHSGAPDDDSYEAGFSEIRERINKLTKDHKIDPIKVEIIETREKKRVALKDTAEKVVKAYGEALVELGEKYKEIVVIDADLSADCGLKEFEERFPDRFMENGIAEQDMVSMAGGLALQGFLPIVNSFGAFLASRANEQIYINNVEYTKIIYVSHYAGLIPAGPGQSHQNLRDISLFGALPNCVTIEPCNALETKLALLWCVSEAKENCLLRLVISPSPRKIILPEGYPHGNKLTKGKGAVLREGKDAVIFSYGPVMLNEALLASEILEKEGFSLKVVNLPWLNYVENNWLLEVTGNCKALYSLDNHQVTGGLGDTLLNAIISSANLRNKPFHKFGVEGYAACGTPQEALRYHKLDGESLANQIKTLTTLNP